MACAIVAAQVRNKLGELGAWATDVGNIKDKAAMELEVKHFLRQIRRPPRMVLVYVSGHGVQEGDEIFLVPSSQKGGFLLWRRSM